MSIPALLATLISGTLVWGGFVPPAELCLPDSGLTELSGCLTMDRMTEECKAMGTYDEKVDCFCKQEILSSYFDCQADIYRCIQMHFHDHLIERNVNQWHSVCDPRFETASLTTPPVPTITNPYDIGDCLRLASSCNEANRRTNLCSRTWLPDSFVSYISCACQPPIYSLMSECMYNGNISCKRTTAHESNIMGHRECPYFWSGSETLPPVDMTSFLSITTITLHQEATGLRQEIDRPMFGASRTLSTIIQTATIDPLPANDDL